MTQQKLTHRMLPIGFTFHWLRYKYHVVQYVRDEQTDALLIVLKVWSKSLKDWSYEVWHAWEYDMKFRKEEFYKQFSQ